MCWNPQNRACFSRQSIWGVTCLHLLEKWMFSNLSSWQLHKCVLKPSEQGSCFSKMINLRGHMPMFTLKMNVFPSIFLATAFCYECVETLRTGLPFSKMINLRGHMPTFTLKNECYAIYLLGNPINECWNPQNRAHFCKTIDLRGHMPRFILKMNVFLSISLETPKLCVETLRRGFIFPDDWCEGSHAYIFQLF